MSQSFRTMEKVEIETVNERCETVKPLSASGDESYEIVKDNYTGDHFLKFAYGDVCQLLPLEYDDVIAIALGEQEYQYPEHWNKPFLRTGDHRFFVWFDPGDAAEWEEGEWLAEQIRTKLAAFKQKGKFDPEETRKLLDELDRLSRDGGLPSE